MEMSLTLASAATLFAAILVIATVSVGAAKLVYAGVAARAGVLFGPHTGARLNMVAAGILILVGVFLIANP